MCFILFILLSYLMFDFVCLTLSLADTHGIAKYARTYIRDTHTQAHTQKKKTGKGKTKTKNKEGGGWGFNGGRGAWVLRRPDLILITLDQHECFSVFHHLQKDKQRKQRHSLKLGKQRRESSKRNYYIISARVIIKAIINQLTCSYVKQSRSSPFVSRKILKMTF